VKVSGGWFLLFPVALGDEEDNLVLRERGLDGRQGCGPADQQRDYYVGENDNIPKRKDRNAVRRRDGLVVALKGLGQDDWMLVRR
jgi:hypothetical protein